MVSRNMKVIRCCCNSCLIQLTGLSRNKQVEVLNLNKLAEFGQTEITSINKSVLYYLSNQMHDVMEDKGCIEPRPNLLKYFPTSEIAM